ncbi:MAG: restriction endonuclease [Bacillota bacterium]|nr:restriction endonuclease [Bacillota bacterium]
MSTLDSLGKNIFYLILIFNAYIVLKNFTLVRRLINSLYVSKENLKRWKSGMINLDDINNLTFDEFKYWCGEFVSGMGYANIIHVSSIKNESKDIVCKGNGRTVYVKCERYSDNSLNKFTVNIHDCKRLVGAMAHDGVCDGIIITSGFIEEACYEYVRSLQEKYKIKLIDGKRVVQLYAELHSRQKKKAA